MKSLKCVYLAITARLRQKGPKSHHPPSPGQSAGDLLPPSRALGMQPGPGEPPSPRTEVSGTAGPGRDGTAAERAWHRRKRGRGRLCSSRAPRSRQTPLPFASCTAEAAARPPARPGLLRPALPCPAGGRGGGSGRAGQPRSVPPAPAPTPHPGRPARPCSAEAGAGQRNARQCSAPKAAFPGLPHAAVAGDAADRAASIFRPPTRPRRRRPPLTSRPPRAREWGGDGGGGCGRARHSAPPASALLPPPRKSAVGVGSRRAAAVGRIKNRRDGGALGARALPRVGDPCQPQLSTLAVTAPWAQTLAPIRHPGVASGMSAWMGACCLLL